MTMREKALRWLRTAIGNPAVDFRDGQWEAIDQLVTQRGRVLCVQRTGWGKSMVYFVAAKLMREQGAGPTLIISPLLALMRNQVDAANRLKLRAETVNSTNVDDWKEVRRRLLADEIDLLLISPERLANDDFVENTLMPIAARIGLLVIDEAHCISDWGHDFRPDYRRIGQILRLLPGNIAVLATTATANRRVEADVKQQLGGAVLIQRGPLVRESLALQTLRFANPAQRLAWLADHVAELPGSGIVYTLTTRDADRVAYWLRENGMSVREIEHAVNLRQSQIEKVLKLLVVEKSSPVVRIGGKWNRTAQPSSLDKPRIEHLTHQRELEWAQMKSYLSNQQCLIVGRTGAGRTGQAGKSGRPLPRRTGRRIGRDDPIKMAHASTPDLGDVHSFHAPSRAGS